MKGTFNNHHHKALMTNIIFLQWKYKTGGWDVFADALVMSGARKSAKRWSRYRVQCFHDEVLCVFTHLFIAHLFSLSNVQLMGTHYHPKPNTLIPIYITIDCSARTSWSRYSIYHHTDICPWRGIDCNVQKKQCKKSSKWQRCFTLMRLSS